MTGSGWSPRGRQARARLTTDHDGPQSRVEARSQERTAAVQRHPAPGHRKVAHLRTHDANQGRRVRPRTLNALPVLLVDVPVRLIRAMARLGLLRGVLH